MQQNHLLDHVRDVKLKDSCFLIELGDVARQTGSLLHLIDQLIKLFQSKLRLMIPFTQVCCEHVYALDQAIIFFGKAAHSGLHRTTQLVINGKPLDLRV